MDDRELEKWKVDCIYKLEENKLQRMYSQTIYQQIAAPDRWHASGPRADRYKHRK